MLLAGRAAEEIINGDVSGGASNDIQRATDIAKQMVTRLGMSDKLGPRCFGTDQGEVFLGRDFSSSQDYSEEIAAQIDSEIHEIIANAYDKAKEVLTDHIDKLHFIAEYLVKNEVMDADQFRAVMERDELTIEEIELIAENKKKQSQIDNQARLEEQKKLEEEKKAEEQKRLDDLKRFEEIANNTPDIDVDFDDDENVREITNENKSDDNKSDEGK